MVGVTGKHNTIYYIKDIFPTEFLNFIGITEPVRYSLSTWVTRLAGSGSGWGYSIFAEAYYNYKEFGFIFSGIRCFVR